MYKVVLTMIGRSKIFAVGHEGTDAPWVMYPNLLKFLSLQLCLLFSLNIWAQEEVILDYNTFIENVLEHHPVSRVAALQKENAIATLQQAKGKFDPKLSGSLNRKDFEGKRYYDLLNAGVKIPTWFGVTFEGGYYQNDGVFLNPERFTPQDGLMQFGASLTLGKGLFIDERRASLRKAQLAEGMAEAEREIILNDLVLSAGDAYWKWFAAYYSFEVYDEVAALAQARFENVKQAVSLGDKSPIDTVEASIQVRMRSVQLQQALLQRQNAERQLAMYMWIEGYIPLELSQVTIPEALDNVSLTVPPNSYVSNLETLIAEHPTIVGTQLDIKKSEIELQWNREQLKPQVDLKYNALNQSIGSDEFRSFNEKDFVFGVDVSIPIFLRKERANVQLSQILIEEKLMKVASKEREIWSKVWQAMNEWQTTFDQHIQMEQAVEEYSRLLSGERQLFNAGESSLFMVNSRESSYASAYVKMVELISKNQITELKTTYSISQFNFE